jgi:hypothetical protein
MWAPSEARNCTVYIAVNIYPCNAQISSFRATEVKSESNVLLSGCPSQYQHEEIPSFKQSMNKHL